MTKEELTEIGQRAYLNLPYAYDTYCLVYPLTVKDIVANGYINYSSYLSILTMDEYDLMKILEAKKAVVKPENINVYKYLLSSAQQDYSFLLEFKNAFRTFIREEINILEDYSIVIGTASDKRILTEYSFYELQNIVRVQNRRQVKTAPPADESAMQRKFRLKAEYRDFVKRTMKTPVGSDEMDFVSLLSVFNCYTDTTPDVFSNISFYAFRELFERYQKRDKYDLDIKSLLAGADPKKIKPESWYKKIKN